MNIKTNKITRTIQEGKNLILISYIIDMPSHVCLFPVMCVLFVHHGWCMQWEFGRFLPITRFSPHSKPNSNNLCVPTPTTASAPPMRSKSMGASKAVAREQVVRTPQGRVKLLGVIRPYETTRWRAHVAHLHIKDKQRYRLVDWLACIETTHAQFLFRIVPLWRNKTKQHKT